MKRIILLFPGQGSQCAGMGKELTENFPEAKKVFEEADEVLGYSLSELCFGDNPELHKTVHTQPAILTHSIAVWEVVKKTDIEVIASAGHSLGEYSALCAAGVLSFSDAVKAVRKRGEFMQSAVPEGVGSMAAVIGLDTEKIEEICSLKQFAGSLSVANYNAPGQTVITGTTEALDKACPLMTEAGASKTVRLQVSAPFHSPLIQSAAEKMKEVLAEIPFHAPSFPVFRNVDVKSSLNGADYRQKLVEQITGSVRWVETFETLSALSADFAVEAGPGKVLMGLGRRINRSLKIIPVSESRDIEKLRGMQ